MIFDVDFEKIELDNCIFYRKDNAEKEEFDLIECNVKKAGYVKIADNEFGDAVFAIYTDNSNTINVSYKGKCKTLRVIEEAGLNTYSSCFNDKKLDVLVTQLKTTYFSFDCGMGYIVRLSDGRFVVIDGGVAEYDEIEHFFETLNSQNELESVPVIALWFITHPHFDHFNFFVKSVTENSDKFILENVVYNYSDKNYSVDESDLTEFNKALELVGKDKIITARTGQKYRFGNDYLEIVLSADDMYPTYLSVNETSLVIKGVFNGKSVMWLADAQKAESEVLVKEYDKTYLKSDIMQVAHHGYWGGSDELHRAIDPNFLLWPSPDYWYLEKIKLDVNQYLKDSSNIKEIFISDREETVLNMTSENFSFKVQEKYKSLKKGETIVEEDFKQKSIYNTNFRCIWGGGTGFEAVKASFCDDGIRLISIDENAYTVMELASPWQTEFALNMNISISASIKKAEEFGIIYNYSSPTLYCEGKILSLPTAKGHYDIELEADADLKTAELYINDKQVLDETYIPEKLRGIYLVFKNADIILKKVKITKE